MNAATSSPYSAESCALTSALVNQKLSSQRLSTTARCRLYWPTTNSLRK